MKNLIFIAACLLMFCKGFAQTFSGDKILAIVGNEIILWSDLESRYKLMESQTGGNLPPNARCLIFDQLLGESLILAQADRDSVVVSDDDVQSQLDARVNEILKYMGGSEEQFRTYYSMSPVEMKELMRDDMRRQLITQKMQGQIGQNIGITPREVQDFFKKIPKDSLPYFNSEVELAEIIIKPKVNPGEDEKALKTAQELRRQLVEDSADFASLAMEYSGDRGSAERGGDLGIVPRGTFVAEFEAAAYQLEVGEISDPVRSEFGYHVIQLLARLGNNIHTRHILIRPLITLDDEEAAARYADSVRTLILIDSLTFDEAIRRFSEDTYSKSRNGDLQNPQTGSPIFETGDLDPDIYFAIDKLKIGEISNPIPYSLPTGETQFRLVKIRNRTEPHAANLREDYSRIQTAALEAKKARASSDWIDKHIPNHHIELKLDAATQKALGDCSALDKWKTTKQP